MTREFWDKTRTEIREEMARELAKLPAVDSNGYPLRKPLKRYTTDATTGLPIEVIEEPPTPVTELPLLDGTPTDTAQDQT